VELKQPNRSGEIFLENLFESNQSGIETGRREIVRGHRGAFESNQSGIETLSVNRYCRLGIKFESNQSGIETSIEFLANRLLDLFESNQSGIETLTIQQPMLSQARLNRTRVELKLRKT